MKNYFVISGLILALASCGEQAPVPSDMRVEAGQAMGTASVDAVMATAIFENICVKTFPDFKKAEAVIKGMPFKVNPNTGTYYHQNADLSVKLMEQDGHKGCSMVFGSKDDRAMIMVMFGALSGQSNTEIDISANGGEAVAGQPLYRALISN